MCACHVLRCINLVTLKKVFLVQRAAEAMARDESIPRHRKLLYFATFNSKGDINIRYSSLPILNTASVKTFEVESHEPESTRELKPPYGTLDSCLSHAGVVVVKRTANLPFNQKCCARGRPIIVEWERDARHSAGLSRSVTHRYVTERYTFSK
ncbi:hypothetical protein EVAR_13495_1 [Eumeta japonica]|uniref:Uncharacterized protein n=1 Tax=Eumeta variegata TaxID=151549 RepID=A0A4C1UY31_EUMVA|nr:hypothetical protein EVAR_13495_1 [Eumeta japonica]